MLEEEQECQQNASLTAINIGAVRFWRKHTKNFGFLFGGMTYRLGKKIHLKFEH